MKLGSALIAVGALCCGPISAAGDSLLALPRPAPQLRQEPTPLGAVNRNQSCEHCHAEIAREWRQSRHRQAYDNDAFQSSLRREPEHRRAFCIACHAPEATPEAFRQSAALGVACVTCHTPLGPVLAAPSPANTNAPHGLLRTTSLTNGAACARCHEFSFPAPNQRLQMQRTLSEHRAVAGSHLGCGGCHMKPEGQGSARHAGHRFAGGHDAKLVRSALSVEVSRPKSDLVRLKLSPRNTTHAVPTGDLFRRLAVRVWSDNGFFYERFLSRHFDDSSGQRRELVDDRVHQSPTVLEVYLPAPAAKQLVRYRVSYERVADLKPGQEAAAQVEGAVTLAQGVLRAR